jgi:hypothetical protein
MSTFIVIQGSSPMDKLNTAIENVKQRFADMKKALVHYNQLKQKEKIRLRAMISPEEWPEIKSKMKDWLNITQDLIDREILYTGFDEDCVFGIRFMRKKLPKLRVVGSDEPPEVERLVNAWEDLTQYLLSKGYLDRIPDAPGFELRNCIVGIQELIKVVEEN